MILAAALVLHIVSETLDDANALSIAAVFDELTRFRILADFFNLLLADSNALYRSPEIGT